MSSPGLRWAWCWWGGPPPDVPTEIPESPTTERWCGHKSPLGSYTEDKVGGEKNNRKQTGRETPKEKDSKLLRLVLAHGGCCDLAAGGETDIIFSDCSTSLVPSLHHTNCFLSQPVHGHAHKMPSQTEECITTRWYYVKFTELTFYLLLSLIWRNDCRLRCGSDSWFLLLRLGKSGQTCPLSGAAVPCLCSKQRWTIFLAFCLPNMNVNLSAGTFLPLNFNWVTAALL